MELALLELEVLGGILRYYEVYGERTVKNKELAKILEKSPSAISRALDSLREKNLVEYKEYSGARLTEKGERIAALYIRKHRLLETFLAKILGMGMSEAHEEAKELSRVVSEKFISRIEAILKNPTVDPHGNPIPSRNGTIKHMEDMPLSKLNTGDKAVVTRIPLEDKTLLDKFGGIGLVPGTEIVVKTVSPTGAMIIKFGETEAALDMETASMIRVRRR